MWKHLSGTRGRGIEITAIRMGLTGVHSFLRNLQEEGIVSPKCSQKEDARAVAGAAIEGHGS